MLSVPQQAHMRGGLSASGVMLTLHTRLVRTTSKHAHCLAGPTIVHENRDDVADILIT